MPVAALTVQTALAPSGLFGPAPATACRLPAVPPVRLAPQVVEVSDCDPTVRGDQSPADSGRLLPSAQTHTL